MLMIYKERKEGFGQQNEYENLFIELKSNCVS